MTGISDCGSSGALGAAMDWLLRLQSAAGDPETCAAFEGWLAQSAENRDAWKQACRAWAIIGEVPPVLAAGWEEGKRINALGQSIRRGRRRLVAAGAVAAIAACLLLFVQPHLNVWFNADFATDAGETRQLMLEDGSEVLLNTDSAIEVRYGQNSRSVFLMKGEAHFDVRPNADAPFVVRSGDLTVTVVGTAFDVRIGGGGDTVGVSSGAVRVRYAGRSGSETSMLRPGDFLAYDRETAQAVVAAIPVDRFTSWHNGRLFLKDVTVGEAVEEIRRYYSGLIILPDLDLAARRVTGLYDVRHPERALRALVEPHGGVLRNPVPFVLMLSGR